MRWFVDLIYLLVGLVYTPVALYHALFVGKNRRGWSQRFGFVPRFDPGRKRIWIHAVSLGEINATPKLVEALGARLPDVDIVFSTTTDTGYARGVKLYGGERVFRFPLDFSLVIARVLKRIHPTMIVLVELEVWPNLVALAARRGIPVAVINGRLTERSARRLKMLGAAVQKMFGSLAWVGAQDETIASRFCELGVPRDRIEVTSSLKWDSASVSECVEGATALAQAMSIDAQRPLWVCGSTGPGEEAIILEAYRKLLDHYAALAQSVQDGRSEDIARRKPQLAIIPRKPERFEEVARLIKRTGFACVRRSGRGDSAEDDVTAASGVYLGDTMGELRKFYSLADVVFVGRTLVPMGGSDPMEVAALGKPMVVGPHTNNFQSPVDALRRHDAIRVIESAEALPGAVEGLLADVAGAASLGARARQVLLEHQGATDKTVEALIRLWNGV